MGNILHLKIYLWTIFLLLFIAQIAVSYPHFGGDFPTLENPYITYTYARFPDIEKHCGSLISSASELPPDDNRGERMKKELFFMNGDWNQESGGAPLMPDIDSREMATDIFGYGPPIKLVSFWLKNVDPIRRANNTVSVSGVMEIGAVKTGSFSNNPYDWSPNFYMRPDSTKLTILFEGIYIESKKNGGQRLMCLLGNATIPSASSQQIDSCEHGDPWRPCQPKVNNLLSTVQDDQIMLVLQYPRTFTLTSRGIIGELKSLNQKGSITYFDKAHISSQLGDKSKYQFVSEELVSSACHPFPYPDSLINRDVEMFKGENFCEDLRQFVWNEVFVFASTWN